MYRICENDFISRGTHTHYSLLVLTVLEQPGPTMAVFEWYIRYMCMHVLPKFGQDRTPKLERDVQTLGCSARGLDSFRTVV